MVLVEKSQTTAEQTGDVGLKWFREMEWPACNHGQRVCSGNDLTTDLCPEDIEVK